MNEQQQSKINELIGWHMRQEFVKVTVSNNFDSTALVVIVYIKSSPVWKYTINSDGSADSCCLDTTYL